MLYKHESFFRFLSAFLPNLSLACWCGYHVSVIRTPYAYSFLPCILAGAPAYPFSQRLANRCQPFFHPWASIVGREGAPDNHSSCRHTHVAGASFSVGAADAQGGGLPPLPAPLFRERQGKRSWPTAHSFLFHGSFCALWSRGRNGRPRCQGFFGLFALGFWEENGAVVMLMAAVIVVAAKVAAVAVALRVVEVRHGN